MAYKKVPVLRLLEQNNLFSGGVREAARGFLFSLMAAGHCTDRTIESYEFTLDLLATYAESQAWPGVSQLTTFHIEAYLVYLRTRPRWFGTRDMALKPLSQSTVETQYRRIKRWFNWMLERGFVDHNPLNIIPHPRVDEKIIPTVSEVEVSALLRDLNPKWATTPSQRFRIIRDRAIVYLLWDTPGRRNEIATLTVDAVDLDAGHIRVMGKGRKERNMPFGEVVKEALWNYMQLRGDVVPYHEEAFWVSAEGLAVQPVWLYRMLKRLGERCGIPNLHTHRFRHSFAMNALRAKIPEQVIREMAGWVDIPPTYFKTLAAEDVAQFHREMSPADRLGRGGPEQRKRGPGKARGRL